MKLADRDLEALRGLLCSMQDAAQRSVVRARDASTIAELSAVAHVTEADTIYRIDEHAEHAILAWFRESWPEAWPVELVMEGLEGNGPVVFPTGTSPDRCAFKCLIDPIDGTRSLMYDKRSAWVLSGIASHRGAATGLSDIVVSAMTEIPPVKQRLADQVSAVRGAGRDGIRAERVDVDGGARDVVRLDPSPATDVMHAFASFARYFPAAKALLARFEERLWERVYGGVPDAAAGESYEPPIIFDDQYICSGGQLYGLLSGSDVMFGDLRPLAFRALGIAGDYVCHPYDVSTLLILEEAGCPVLDPTGAPLDAPMDTTSPVSWIGFANPDLAERIWPDLAAVIVEFFGAP